MSEMLRRKFRAALVTVLVVAASACAAPPPPPPPPPPPKPVYIPPRPLPPLGAYDKLALPPIGPNGVRQTVNANISTAQRLWNVRSAYNVAALNCLDPRYAEILPAYRTFLRVQAKGLTTANQTVDREFRAKAGARFVPVRETYMTQVYNHFAFPPTLGNFCDASLVIARDSLTVPATGTGLNDFADRNMPLLETVMNNFYRDYERYQADVVAWDALYAPRPALVPATPGTQAGTPGTGQPAIAPAQGTTIQGSAVPSSTVPGITVPGTTVPSGTVPSGTVPSGTGQTGPAQERSTAPGFTLPVG